MIAWIKKLFGRKDKGLSYANQVAKRRALVEEIDRKRHKALAAKVVQFEGRDVSLTSKSKETYGRPVASANLGATPRPARVSPSLAVAYGRQQPPVRRHDEPSPDIDMALVYALAASHPAPAPDSTVSTTSDSCRAPSYSSGGGGDFGGGGASSSWSSDSGSSSSDSGSSSSSSD